MKKYRLYWYKQLEREALVRVSWLNQEVLVKHEQAPTAPKLEG